MPWLDALRGGGRAGGTGSYARVADIASGGVGHVDLVLRREGSFERFYARKRLRAEHREEHDFRTMFFDEARIAGLVRHPHVVSVLDVGEDEDGPFLVMDYVEGVPVSTIIARAASSSTPVPLQLALRIGIEAARGLHAAHELVDRDGAPLELVHRDVSPQNILVGFDGVTRVTDFGVAKAFGRSTRTETGVLKGKLGYASPEQLRFEELDRRSDLFSLGVVLYELLSGERLYRNVNGHDGVRRILNEPPPDLGAVRDDAPPELVELLFSMLAKGPEHRPESARAVAETLEDVLSDLTSTQGRLDLAAYMRETFSAEREAQRSRARSRPRLLRPRSRRALGVLGAATGLAVLGAVAWATAVWTSERATAAAAPDVGVETAVAGGGMIATETETAAETETGAEPGLGAQAGDRDTASARRAQERTPRRGAARRRTTVREPERARERVPTWDWQQP
jgi:serine/threonine protein kinase